MTIDFALIRNIASFLVLGMAAVSCADDTKSPSAASQDQGVYAAGQQDGAAVYWKNGSVIPLVKGSTGSSAQSIFLSGNDVYVSGTTGSQGSDAVYWKNGVQVAVTGHDSHSIAIASAIAVSNSSVYVSGFSCPIYENCVASYWKDEKSVSLSENLGTTVVSGMSVSGGDVYVAGTVVTTACVWKNGIIQKLTPESTSLSSSATGVFVTNGDVYVAGTTTRENLVGIATYWKNGVSHELTDGTKWADANAIFISGSDVYVAGQQKTATGNMATLWKNGVATALTDGKGVAKATCLAFSNGDVYVGGYEINDAGIYVAKYWINGSEVLLGNGVVYSIAVN